MQLGYASWSAVVRTFGADLVNNQALDPVLNMLGHVKLNNNQDERTQGWYSIEKGTKQRLHHEQIEIFAKDLKDSYKLRTRQMDTADNLPNNKSIVLGPSDMAILDLP